MKLLIAEDDLTSRIMLTAVASKWGYEPVAVEDGEAAWQVMLGEEPPSLLLIDWEMPKLDGLALCQRIRQQGSINPPYIILLTGRGDTADIVAGLAAGANGYIAKPFENAELQARLQEGKRTLGLQTDLFQAMSRLRLTAKVFSHVREGIIITDADTCILDVNDAFVQITGYSREEAVGEKPNALLKLERQGPEFYAGLWSELNKEGFWSGEIWSCYKSGGVFPWMLTISAVRDANDKIQNYVALFSDITERVKTEEKQASLQKQLQQAQKMEAIGQLTGGIAHDFNNMLASILGYTELARNVVGDGNDNMERYLGEIHKAGARARDLIAQMLAFSRGGEVEYKPMAVAPLVEDSLRMLRTLLPSSIEVSTHIDVDTPEIKTDRVQVHQIVMNLCINARDAMESKGQLSVALRRIDGVAAVCSSCYKAIGGEFVEISISDTGDGIEQEQLSRIFDPFFSTKEVGKGTGMGLSMVHGIMHDHGGHIVVETEPGEGTTFILLFPMLDEQTCTRSSEADAVNTAPAQILNSHVLVVDDEELVGGFLSELLTDAGCQVTVETDSQLALARFKEDPELFDLVVTDQTMPGLTGTDLAQSLLAIRPELPIILCTGYSDDVGEAKAKSLGIKAFVNKPIKLDGFLALVGSLLQ